MLIGQEDNRTRFFISLETAKAVKQAEKAFQKLKAKQKLTKTKCTD
jgi:hypothetical protein